MLHTLFDTYHLQGCLLSRASLLMFQGCVQTPVRRSLPLSLPAPNETLLDHDFAHTSSIPPDSDQQIEPCTRTTSACGCRF